MDALAQDARWSIADVLNNIMQRLAKRWLKRLSKAPHVMATWFAQSQADRTDASLKAALKKSGMTVKFQPSKAQLDVVDASIAENVALIKSIPQQYLSQVEQAVARSVAMGRDLKSLTDDIQRIGGVTRRRAEFIAKDQSNKVNASMVRARQLDLGITQAVWRHSAAGKTPRPSHVKAGRERRVYDVAKGMWDEDEGKFIQPGELVGCKCKCLSIIPG
jgi:uncharacterized protein with gpF-like domain